MPSVGIAIITHNARDHLTYCLPPLLASSLKPRILVVNSSSEDGTLEMARSYSVETLQVPRAPFNHGTVRELARKKLSTEIVIFITPDAYAVDGEVVGKLVAPLLGGQAACAYARQIPHKGASIWEAFPRYFNYPENSQLRTFQEIPFYGVYTFFFSNSFGAYLNSALDEVGGFKPVLTGEDTLACAQLLLKGYKVAYVAEAQVYHSHNYSLNQEFKRYFDTGISRKEQIEIFKLCGQERDRGWAYLKALCVYLKEQQKLHLIPYALFHSFIKWLGFTLGWNSHLLPINLKRQFSSQSFYW